MKKMDTNGGDKGFELWVFGHSDILSESTGRPTDIVGLSNSGSSDNQIFTSKSTGRSPKACVSYPSFSPPLGDPILISSFACLLSPHPRSSPKHRFSHLYAYSMHTPEPNLCPETDPRRPAGDFMPYLLPGQLLRPDRENYDTGCQIGSILAGKSCRPVSLGWDQLIGIEDGRPLVGLELASSSGR